MGNRAITKLFFGFNILRLRGIVVSQNRYKMLLFVDFKFSGWFAHMNSQAGNKEDRFMNIDQLGGITRSIFNLRMKEHEMVIQELDQQDRDHGPARWAK